MAELLLLARMVVPKFGQKWFLFLDFRYLWAVSTAAIGFGFFAFLALLVVLSG